jgi:TolA-binding protein
VYLALGEAFHKSGKHREAAAQFAAALKLKPSDRKAQELLAREASETKP